MATIEELLAEIAALQQRLVALQGDPEERTYFGGSLEKENDQIEKYLSDFTHREGVMLTIAGLFTLIPFTDTKATTMYFLIWVMPFLFLAIGTYVLSTKRLNFIPSLSRVGLTTNGINNLLKRSYFSALHFHRLTDALLVIFFTSFVVNFYLYIFVALPKANLAIWIVALAVLVGVARLLFSSKVSKSNDTPGVLATGDIGPDDGVIGVGGDSPEEDSEISQP